MRKEFMASDARRLVTCIDNTGYIASLERGKKYVVIPDARAERLGQIRVIDESGEDYLYAKEAFEEVSPVDSNVVIGQILGGTRLDSQGEHLTREQLREFAAGAEGQRVPLNAHHDMSLPPGGFIENIRVIPDSQSPNDWLLVGDVTIESGSLNELLKGFSISFFEPLFPGEGGSVYLPFPFYNDPALISQLRSIDGLGVGKWIQKNAAPQTISAFITSEALISRPRWDPDYLDFVTGYFTEIISHYRAAATVMAKRKILLEFVQQIMFGSSSVEVRFIRRQIGRDTLLTVKQAIEGIKLANGVIFESKPELTKPRRRIVLKYDAHENRYSIDRVD